MIPLIVKVKPASFKDEITMDESGMLVIKIKERPIDGAANAYLIQFLAKEFKLSKSDIILEKGTKSRFKKIFLNINQTNFDTLMNVYKK